MNLVELFGNYVADRVRIDLNYTEPWGISPSNFDLVDVKHMVMSDYGKEIEGKTKKDLDLVVDELRNTLKKYENSDKVQMADFSVPENSGHSIRISRDGFSLLVYEKYVLRYKRTHLNFIIGIINES